MADRTIPDVAGRDLLGPATDWDTWQANYKRLLEEAVAIEAKNAERLAELGQRLDIQISAIQIRLEALIEGTLTGPYQRAAFDHKYETAIAAYLDTVLGAE